MFNRRKYKKYARIQLKKRYTIPVLMTLIDVFISTILNIPDFLNIYYTNGTTTANYSELRTFLGFLITSVVLYAQIHVYLKMSKSPEPVHFSDFIEGFNSWARSILATLWEALWTTLWFFLFIIPGIVKHYSYSLTRYLVSEFPELSITQAMRISITITNGHKSEIFITDLSLLGWFIISLATCGIGFLWLFPYREMIMVNIYHSLLKDAIATGIVKPEDLEE